MTVLAREIQLELLLGKTVCGIGDKPIGPLEEIVAEQRGDECFIEEYHVGSYAVLERLSAWTFGRAILHVFGGTQRNRGYRVPWDKLDLSDFQRPKLRCRVSELKLLGD
jgi:hypothetical protein